MFVGRQVRFAWMRAARSFSSFFRGYSTQNSAHNTSTKLPIFLSRQTAFYYPAKKYNNYMHELCMQKLGIKCCSYTYRRIVAHRGAVRHRRVVISPSRCAYSSPSSRRSSSGWRCT